MTPGLRKCETTVTSSRVLMLFPSLTQRIEKGRGKSDRSGNYGYAPLSDTVDVVLQLKHEVHSPTAGNLL